MGRLPFPAQYSTRRSRPRPGASSVSSSEIEPVRSDLVLPIRFCSDGDVRRLRGSLSFVWNQTPATARVVRVRSPALPVSARDRARNGEGVGPWEAAGRSAAYLASALALIRNFIWMR